MDKINEIESFLKLIVEISKSGVNIDDNLVYSNLIKKEVKSNIKSLFPLYKDKYEYDENIKCSKESNKYFINFRSRNLNINNYNKIKVYIPLDIDHIYNGSILLFDFLSSNNIKHVSKISSDIRIDDLVVNVFNESDLEKLRYFVLHNDYLREGLLKPNPFLINDGVLSYTWDGNLSYNLCISKYISMYINDKIKNKSLNYVSYSDFYTYITKNYNDVFKNGKNINEFLFNMNIGYSSSDLCSIEGVSRLLLESLKPTSNLDDLYKLRKIVIDKEYYDYNYKKLNEFISQKDNTISDIDSEEFDSLFLEISKKYGTKDATKRLDAYIKSGNINLFDKKLRDRVSSISLEDINNLFTNMKKDMLYDASIKTFKKYGDFQLKYALRHSLVKEFKGFTNDDDIRKNLREIMNETDINSLIVDILKDNNSYNSDDNKIDSFVNIIRLEAMGKTK